MKSVFQIIGSLLIISLLIAHFFLIALLVAPTNKLLGLLIENDQGFVSVTEISEAVQSFLVDNKVSVNGDYQLNQSNKGRFIFGILQLRRKYFMEPTEQIALDANLLNYGGGLIGVESASEYFYGKSLSEISDREWITLVNLNSIFSKNN
ncbi:hypothetical protein JXD20_04690 [Candidatus Peregrinibacteria bacterium]|nr:hypothetical protein [Candidatus Peregrinibacteria bacterium]